MINTFLLKMKASTYIHRLESIDMTLWKKIPNIGEDVLQISIEIITSENNYIFIQKFKENELTIFGKQHISEDVQKIFIKYTIPSTIRNKYIVQDIIASELFRSKYKVVIKTPFKNIEMFILEPSLIL